MVMISEVPRNGRKPAGDNTGKPKIFTTGKVTYERADFGCSWTGRSVSDKATTFPLAFYNSARVAGVEEVIF